ncbi:MAG TPA: class I SAM-dependent methyltransferase [Flavobacteriales bacterium]|nr:class I SAM-dependent methyltransferase [Flavobacteriales bacterium]
MMKIDESLMELCQCPMCLKDDFKKVFQIKGFSIVKCNNCTMVYVNPRLKDKAIYKIYEKDYFIKPGYTFDDFGYGNYDITAHLRDKTFNRWMDVIEPYLKTLSGVALDVGCATGRLLDVLVQRKWNVKAIELDKGMCENLRDRGFEVNNQPLEQYTTDKKLQLITIFDVIEHLPHPNNDFKNLFKILDDNGSIIIVTPNIESLQRKIFGKYWFQFKPREHISYFSPKTIRRIAEENGLKVVKTFSCGQYADLGFINHRLHRYEFIIFASLLEKFMKLSGLKNMAWYVNTGSTLAILQKS